MEDLAILIVEDEKINRAILTKVFRDDYQICQACDGRQAFGDSGIRYSNRFNSS